MKNFSIIIPFFNNWKLTNDRLMELFRLIPKSEILLVDDASTEPGIIDFVKYWKSVGKHDIKYGRNKENMGFGYSMNVGAQNASGDVLVFLSNDVEVGNDFVTDIQHSLDRDDKVLIGKRYLYHDTGWNVIDGTICPYLEGWFLACTKEVWEDLGGFDPLFFPYDCEDIDLSLTALLKGYKLVTLDSTVLRHIGAQTARYGEAREAITKRNQQRLVEKWTPIIHEQERNFICS